ncbi:hypothetical protein [Burkholderia sp. 22PA0106]|uniref:hypothetical protein n=1 Tax=Burkholderia sp. 22PA0106 TaxID=3237371 RepID=UPI0039C189DC
MQKSTIETPAEPLLPTAGLIAVVGCDGTGKSTLTADLARTFNLETPAKRCYLGLVSGEAGDRIKHLPLIGVWLERRLAAKSEQAQDMRNKRPAIWAALIMYGLSLWRAAHLWRAHRLARRGTLVITDRYPQAEVSGFHFDGPGLGVERSGQGWLGKLAAREQRLYRRMAMHRPALVIRLGIDVDTAHARKPDHSLAELRNKITVMAELQFDGAAILDLDTRVPYAEVREKALRAVLATTATDQDRKPNVADRPA